MRALVTGATGFVGRVLVDELLRRGFAVRGAVRRKVLLAASAEPVDVGNLTPNTDWRAALQDVDTVFHLAARVHVRGNPQEDAEHERVNVAATAALANASVDAGVRRFVFVSSVKVMGECSKQGPFNESDLTRPQDAYGRSKLAAEELLAQTARAMALTIVRPPLVYGPGVRANFLSLLRLADSPWPLPLAAAVARRSMVYVGNLVDALIACATVPHPVPAVYFVADDQDLSVAELVKELRAAFGLRTRLWPLPAAAAGVLAAVIGRRDAAQRLFAPLQIDTNRIRRELGWAPPFDQREALALTARWFRATRSGAA